MYRVIDVTGTSTQSREDTAAAAVKSASETLCGLRVAEVVEQDLHIVQVVDVDHGPVNSGQLISDGVPIGSADGWPAPPGNLHQSAVPPIFMRCEPNSRRPGLPPPEPEPGAPDLLPRGVPAIVACATQVAAGS